MRRLVLIGASGQGKACSDVAISCGYSDIIFLNDEKAGGRCGGFEVAGKCEDYRYYLYNSDFFVSIGNASYRRKLVDLIESAGGTVVSLAHSSAIIGSNVTIGRGSVVIAGAVINHSAYLGKGVIVNTATSIDHDCIIGNYCHVAVGAHVCGTVDIGPSTWIGAGATIINNKSICKDTMIGAGAVVVDDIMVSGTYVGVPAKIIQNKV